MFANGATLPTQNTKKQHERDKNKNYLRRIFAR